MSIMIFAGVRERIHFADPPAVFRGIPIALVAAALLAMAFAGFHGVEIK
jgi:electron transport complex protein RnfA